MDLTLRAAVPADVPAIEELLRTSRLPTDGVAGIVGDVPEAFVVAVQGGAIVGAGGLEPAGDDALLRSVVVREDLRACGVGRLVVRRLIENAERSGVRGVYLLTTTADAWFPQFGFTRVERSGVPGAVGGTWEFKTGCAATAVAMERLGVAKDRS